MEPKEGKVRTVPRNIADIQRLKLEKLMENPEKLVIIPERHKDKTLPPPPEFNRNVMGSSAGAGSGEFHVYRHIRRREYARQKLINEKARRETLDDAYHQKLEDNKRIADEKTAKKRAKRLKKKDKKKSKKQKPNKKKEELKSESESEKSEEESSEDENTKEIEEKEKSDNQSSEDENTKEIKEKEKSDDENTKEIEEKEKSDDENSSIEDVKGENSI